MKKLLRIFVSLMLGAILASCDVHELPEGEDYVRLTFHLQYDEEMPLFHDIEFESKSGEEDEASNSPYALRTVLRLYESQPGGTWATVPFWSKALVDNDLTTLERDFTILLPPKRIRALVWTDFVRTDNTPNFYSIESFPEIRMNPEANGGGEFKSSFYAVEEARMDEVMELNADIIQNVDMQRASAKICFYANDVKDYIAELKKRSSSSIDLDALSPSTLNLSQFTLKVNYLGFLPDAWNVREGLASDSSYGHTFTSGGRLDEDGNVYLGCDWIFSSEDTTIDMEIELYDDKGVMLTRLNTLQVPIARGKITNIRGKFMTHGISGSVVIDNEYDGDINVYI